MAQMVFLKKAWNDSVWSKVIASAITTAFGTILVIIDRYWEVLKEAAAPVYWVATVPVVVPAWLLAVLGLMLMAALSSRVGRKHGVDERDYQPNAIPIVEATVVTPSLAVTGAILQTSTEPSEPTSSSLT